MVSSITTTVFNGSIFRHHLLNHSDAKFVCLTRFSLVLRSNFLLKTLYCLRIRFDLLQATLNNVLKILEFENMVLKHRYLLQNLKRILISAYDINYSLRESCNSTIEIYRCMGFQILLSKSD